MANAVADGKVVTIHFTLRTEGEVADTTAEGAPVLYLHGADNIVPGLEDALIGKVPGDEVSVTVDPARGYGERVDQPPLRVPRDQFPADFPLQMGLPVGGEDEDGNVTPFWVTHVDDDTVVLDPNHPLAGKVLDFTVRIVDVRDATAEELAHGHPHGPGGAH